MKDHHTPVFLTIAIMLTSVVLPVQADLYINEIMADADETDQYSTPLDWIELFNSGFERVDLIGYYLSDEPDNPRKWMIGPVTIASRGYLRLWATGYDLYDPNAFHTNFRLKKEGESLTLADPSGIILDSVTFPLQQEEISYGRREDGANLWGYFLTPTPAKSNSTPWLEGFASAPTVSIEGGIVNHPLTVEIKKTDPETQIHYTLDGSDPDMNDSLYRAPLSITQTTILRAKAFKLDHSPSPTVTHSYIFHSNPPLPILSLVTDPKNLWDKTTGIYANPTADGYAWERPASVELLLQEGRRAFGETCGVRIHGGASRTRSPKKSFRLYFRSEYGPKKLKYPLFSDTSIAEFDDLVLRAGFNDSWGYDNEMQRVTAILASDQVCRDLHQDMGQVVVHGIWVELYLNGEYWGIYNPTERLKPDFMQSYYGGENWTIVTDGEVTEGNASTWSQFKNEVSSLQLSSRQKYEEFQQVLDIENFTTYVVLNIWVMNYDWPHHNWTASKEENGPWRFYLWDVEYSFGSGIQGYKVNVDTVDKAKSGDVGLIFNKLLTNPDYYHYFWNVLRDSIKTVFSEDHATARLNQELDAIRAAIPAEAEKWGRGKTVQDWEKAGQLARDFIKARTPYVLQHVRSGIGPEPVAVDTWALY